MKDEHWCVVCVAIAFSQLFLIDSGFAFRHQWVFWTAMAVCLVIFAKVFWSLRRRGW